MNFGVFFTIKKLIRELPWTQISRKTRTSYLILLPTIMSFINSLGTLFQLTAENDYLFLEMRRSTVSQAAFRGLKSKSAENSREYFHGTGRSFYHINM